MSETKGKVDMMNVGRKGKCGTLEIERGKEIKIRCEGRERSETGKDGKAVEKNRSTCGGKGSE